MDERFDLGRGEAEMHRLGEKAIECRDEPLASRFLRQFLPGTGDEDAEAGARADEPFAFEFGVNASDGVGIDVTSRGKDNSRTDGSFSSAASVPDGDPFGGSAA